MIKVLEISGRSEEMERKIFWAGRMAKNREYSCYGTSKVGSVESHSNVDC